MASYRTKNLGNGANGHSSKSADVEQGYNSQPNHYHHHHQQLSPLPHHQQQQVQQQQPQSVYELNRSGLRSTTGLVRTAASVPLLSPSSSSSSSISSLPSAPSSTVDVRLNGIRILIAMLFFLALITLTVVAYDHFSFVSIPTIACFDEQHCQQQQQQQQQQQNTGSTTPVAPKLVTAIVSPGDFKAIHSTAVIPPIPQSSSAYYDDLSDLLSFPLLFPILAVNSITVYSNGQAVDLNDAGYQQKANEHTTRISEKLSANKLKHLQWQTGGKFITMAQWKELHPDSPFITTSVRNTNYTISSWSNLCYTFGGEKDPHLVFVGDTQTHTDLLANVITKQDHNKFSWLPPRYVNDQGRLKVQETPDSTWIYIPAIPPDADGLVKPSSDSKAELVAATFHQFQWDFNVGHQFHQQVWPMYQALYSQQFFHTPIIQSLLMDHGCAATDSNTGVRHGSWKPINQFFGRIVLDGVKDRVRIMQQDCTNPGGVCFERVVFNDGKDQYLDKGGEESFVTFRAFRSLILETLEFSPPPFAGHHAALVAKSQGKSPPLRITIYSRLDSNRRHIVNVPALTAALSPYHIVRHIPVFGPRPPIEQLALYANTDILIAPHGAHMTFTFLMPDDALVVECFAHAEGKFSWTVNFLKATNKRHVQQIGFAKNETVQLTVDMRHMDKDFDVDLLQLCQSFKLYNIPIQYDC